MNTQLAITVLLLFARGRIQRLAQAIADFQAMSPPERRARLAVIVAKDLKISNDLARGIVTEAAIRNKDIRKLLGEE
jgi:hypothetical protein